MSSFTSYRDMGLWGRLGETGLPRKKEILESSNYCLILQKIGGKIMLSVILYVLCTIAFLPEIFSNNK